MLPILYIFPDFKRHRPLVPEISFGFSTQKKSVSYIKIKNILNKLFALNCLNVIHKMDDSHNNIDANAVI